MLCNETPFLRGFRYIPWLPPPFRIAILFIKTPLFGGFCYKERHGPHNPIIIGTGEQGGAGAH
jgi:hypothetical protein